MKDAAKNAEMSVISDVVNLSKLELGMFACVGVRSVRSERFVLLFELEIVGLLLSGNWVVVIVSKTVISRFEG
jgi:hypothetical protein